MVYLKRWEAFVEATEALYSSSPAKTRYCVRWRHDVGLLVLKVTDDNKCIKFKTRSSVFLNRFELLNRDMLSMMQDRRRSSQIEPVKHDANALTEGGESTTKERSLAGDAGSGMGPATTPSASGDGAAATTTAHTGGSSSKKKKGKKKK